jgi:pyruvate dehydrogenase E2 component (dihydrolipoamide acetyltransferase)
MGVFAMPSLGSDMESGKLVEWLVGPGDRVARGDVVAVVETQKGAIEIETFEPGMVHELKAELGTELPVGAPMAVILAEGEAPPAEAPPAEAPPAETPSAEAPPAETPSAEARPAETSSAEASAPPAEPARAEPSPAPAASPVEAPALAGAGADVAEAPPPAPPAGGSRVSPAARVRARDLKVDVTGLTGSGPDGAIVVADVERAAAAAGGASARRPSRGGSAMEEMRKAIAAAMTRAKRTIPHYYLTHTIDVTPAIAFLEDRNAGRPPAERLLLGALFVRAAALAAARAPTMNGRYSDETGFEPSETVNAGVAVALRGGGLVAPALMDAAALTLDETMAGMRDLVTRARAGRLKNSEMTQGTITISSLGESGAEAMTGVIFPPQVALVALGAPRERPWVADGAVVPRRTVTLTLSADHRVSDGRQGARFVEAVEELLQKPEEL